VLLTATAVVRAAAPRRATAAVPVAAGRVAVRVAAAVRVVVRVAAAVAGVEDHDGA
jgi:hypothetical protein